MRKLHDSIETGKLIAIIRLPDEMVTVANADQVYVSEDGKHAIVHSVYTNGRRRVDTFTNVERLAITGA